MRDQLCGLIIQWNLCIVVRTQLRRGGLIIQLVLRGGHYIHRFHCIIRPPLYSSQLVGS